MPIETGQSTRKRVWVLGAGFSRSLGGPLMNDLLSLAARRRILAAYSSYIDRDEVDTIFWLFHYGCGFPEGRLDPRIAEQGEHAWDDAEQFLETLDNARSDAAKAAAVASALSGLEIIAQNSGQGLVETASPAPQCIPPRPQTDGTCACRDGPAYGRGVVLHVLGWSRSCACSREGTMAAISRVASLAPAR